MNGAVRSPDALADDVVPAADSVPAQWPGECPRPPALRLIVRRSVPVTLVDGALPTTFYTTRPTVGEALLAGGMLLYPGDQVSPALDSRVVPGLHVYIQRATPVTVQVDGRTLHTRTQRRTVGQVLAQEGIALMGRDYSMPPPGARVVRRHGGAGRACAGDHQDQARDHSL